MSSPSSASENYKHLLQLAEENLSLLNALQINPQTGEPFLTLPKPYSNIIITPPRLESDLEAIVRILNDPKVHLQLPGAPYPHTKDHARKFLAPCAEACRRVLDTLVDNAQGRKDRALVDGCPVRILREVKEDGSDVYIGDIGCLRNSFFHVVDPEEAKKLNEENKKREIGDPEIVWSIGDYLASEYHGRGIMTAAVHTLIHEWMVPRMGVRRIITNAPKDNTGSVRVFEKNGFKMIDTTEDCKEKPESKGGGKFGLHVLEWTTEEDRQ